MMSGYFAAIMAIVPLPPPDIPGRETYDFHGATLNAKEKADRNSEFRRVKEPRSVIAMPAT